MKPLQYKKLKKVAVILYGQPRFIDINYKSLKEEFSYNGVEFDYFIHFWKDVSFSPESERNYRSYDYTEQIKTNCNYLNVKKLMIEDYNILDEYISNIENVLHIIKKQKFYKTKKFTGTSLNSKRYKWGQHLSLLNAYNMLEEYEKNNNMQYDIVIKARTDFAYKNKQCYKHEQDYLNDKYEAYLDFKLDTPIVKSSGAQFRQYNPTTNNYILHPGEFKNIKKGKLLNFKQINWVRNKKNFFRLADISQTSNRKAADFYFKQHLAIYLRVFLNNYCNKDYITFDKHDAIQGDIAYYNNIEVYKTQCRYHRLVRKNDCNNSWIEKRGVIFPTKSDETHEFVNKQLKELYEHK